VQQPHSEPELPPAMERAEELVDIAGQRLGVFLSRMSAQLQRTAALAREEGEDIWAEAQSIRQEKGGRFRNGRPA
jgi:hypothetical protein